MNGLLRAAGRAEFYANICHPSSWLKEAVA